MKIRGNKIIYLFVAWISFSTSLSFATNQKENIRLNAIDTFILKSMKKHQVPAVSIAIIDKGKIKYTHAYSLINKLRVTPHTLFQSASIGKSVSAYGALLLVKQNKINLDKPQ